MATASDVMVETLVDWGVDTIFGFPGDGINGFFEALRRHQDSIRFIQVRHEESAAFAACAYAKFTGKLGVCVATSGPGGVHLLNGLYDAQADGVPVLAITGQQYSDLLGMSYVQGQDLVALYQNVAAFNQMIQGADDVFNLTNLACRTALSRRTVSHLNFPINYQVDDAASDFYSHHGGPPKTPEQLVQPAAPFYRATSDYPQETPVPNPDALRRAADVLNAGTKVAILVGHGALAARPEVVQVAEMLAAPVVKTLLGKGVLPDDSPYTTGGVGLLGTQPSVNAMNECDTLLLIGTSFPYVNFLPKPGQARGVQIEIDETRLGLRFPVEVGLVGDARATLQALLPLLQRKDDRSFLDARRQDTERWKRYIHDKGTQTGLPMKPEVVAYALNKFAAANAVICADTGTCTTWIARDFFLKEDQLFSASGNLATMANGLPYAIAAQVAYPDRQVIAFVGDGGFTMLMGEMLTAVKYNLPIKVIIVKNNVLGQIKWEQIVFLGAPEFGVELQPADFAAWARAAGGEGYCVEDPAKIEDVMAQFLASPRPAILEAVVDPNEPPLPPSVMPEDALHFAEALARGQPDRARIALTALRDKVEEWWKT
ncbi:MAG TPA: thiamine pyrophosphate-dependent enzyme [Chloroflexota bacterium]|nr:thiamine pyrophosphate-dependent enzyme [Chloroflexota bacterium]